MFYQVWSLSMIHMLISWLKYVEMLAVVQIVTLRFEGGNDFEIYTHPRTIGHSHRLGDKRSTVVYGIHMAFTWHSLHNSFLAKTSGKCFPRVFHVLLCAKIHTKALMTKIHSQPSKSPILWVLRAFWQFCILISKDQETSKDNSEEIVKISSNFAMCLYDPLCAFHNVNMFVDVVQFSPEIHPDGTQTFAISMQCLAAHCCTLLHLPASWGWRSFLVSQHQNLWRHQAPLSEMIWNVRAVLRCLRCS